MEETVKQICNHQPLSTIMLQGPKEYSCHDNTDNEKNLRYLTLFYASFEETFTKTLKRRNQSFKL